MKTLIVITGFIVILAIEPILALVYLATILAIAAVWYSFKAIAWLLRGQP